MFVLLTQDNWAENMYLLMMLTKPWAALYTLTVLIIGVYMLLNLFLAVLLANLDEAPGNASTVTSLPVTSMHVKKGGEEEGQEVDSDKDLDEEEEENKNGAEKLRNDEDDLSSLSDLDDGNGQAYGDGGAQTKRRSVSMMNGGVGRGPRVRCLAPTSLWVPERLQEEMHQVWKCIRCGNASGVEMHQVWKCIRCVNAPGVEMHQVWKVHSGL